MHAYFLARGITKHIKEWASELGHQYVPLDFKDKDGKVEHRVAQVQVRELKLYEIVFPKSAEAAIMGVIDPSEYKVLGKWTGYVKFLSKMLGLKKCLPRDKWKKPGIPLHRECSLLPLGVKEDKTNWELPPVTDTFAQGKTPQEMI